MGVDFKSCNARTKLIMPAHSIKTKAIKSIVFHSASCIYLNFALLGWAIQFAGINSTCPCGVDVSKIKTNHEFINSYGNNPKLSGMQGVIRVVF